MRNLLPERCSLDVDLILLNELIQHIELRGQSATCCWCLEPLGRHGSFKRIKDLVFHGDECWRIHRARTSNPANEMRENYNLEDGLPLDVKIRNKFTVGFTMKQHYPEHKGPTIAEFLKLLRLE